jgi:hypothetical protein
MIQPSDDAASQRMCHTARLVDSASGTWWRVSLDVCRSDVPLDY